jgi:hypothetical protein
LSPQCELRVTSEAPIKRLKLTKEEIEVINNGGADVGDWRKIKM